MGGVNLHDWIDELCDVLDVDVDVDEALVLDLARVSSHQVQRTAAPITTFLLGYAAGLADADEAGVEALAARATALAESWGRPPRAPAPDEGEAQVEGADHRGVDHSPGVADLIS